MQERIPSPNEDKNKLGRREFIKKLAVLGTGVALSGKFPAAEAETSTLIEKTDAASKELREVTKPTVYKTGPLEGRNFPADSLFDYFTGVSGKLPAEVTIDFSKRLKFLFTKKEEFTKKHNKSNTAFKQAENTLLKEYAQKSPGRIDLHTYEINVASAMGEIRQNIDWLKVQEIMRLNTAELEILQGIIASLSSKHLTAYALTELMPSDSGTLNRDVYEFLLKNAGARYVYSIPSIYDDRLSFGPYQFTSGALMDTGDANPVGASKINRALPEANRISGSVLKLKGTDHHKAALLFAIHNVASLMRQLKSERIYDT